MEKNCFWFLLISLLLLASAGPLFAANRAATRLGSKFYSRGNGYLSSQEWSRALRAFEIASLLDPEFHLARQKREEWGLRLKQKGEEKFLEGRFAFQNRRFSEAKLHWEEGLRYLVEADNPLREKIQKELEMIDAGENRFVLDWELEVFQPGMREKMREVKTFLKRGEKSQAILVLNEILSKEPENERAKILLARLQEEEAGNQERDDQSEEIRNRFQKAQGLFDEGMKTKEYQKFKEALALFQEGDLKPSFYQQLVTEAKGLEEILKQKLEPSLKRWSRDLEAPSADLKKMGTELREVEKKYPPTPEVLGILQKIYSSLDQKAKPFLIRAKTLQEMEGCKKAVDKFVRVKEIAVFEEVKAWKEAERKIGACGGGKKK